MELVRLAELPSVDAQALTECVASDPALACKVLRVVNSSLFGLNRPVADLNQAIGLLGIKPLKLLVLGFTLPDSLFADVAARELEWYWTNTLTRAVAARVLAEQLYRQPGDEAFIAGLLQDIGILVLLRELGAPYARFLTGVIEEKCPLAALEQDTLGFDHVQLSAAVLAHWQLPERLVSAIAAPKHVTRLARMHPPAGDLPQILHLAEMLGQLVGQSRMDLLPELLEAGKLYRGMTKSKLASLVEGLQPQVDQLADVLALELAGERDYVQVLADAQRRMASLGEDVAGAASNAKTDHDDALYADLLAQAGELSHAMRTFLAGGKHAATVSGKSGQQHSAHESPKAKRGTTGKQPAQAANEPADRSLLLRKLIGAANRCRERRQELTLLLAEPNVFDLRADPRGALAGKAVGQALARACGSIEPDKISLVTLANGSTAAIISDCERSFALSVAHHTIAQVTEDDEIDNDLATTLSIGVATVSVVPKNFDPVQMVESAARCLSAARACGTSAVKSIEV